MIDLTQMRIEQDAREQLPADWLRQLEVGMASNYSVAYDATLDEAHVWFGLDRTHAVQVPLTPLIDLTIDDETDQIIGFVARPFAQIVLAMFPQSAQIMILDPSTKQLRLPGDIAMTPIQKLTSVVPSDIVARALSRATHLIAA